MKTNTIRAAFRRLGPKRVKKALRAFKDPAAKGSWESCFLARAFDPIGYLMNAPGSLNELTGLTPYQRWAIVDAFDGDDEERAKLKAEAKRFLAEQEGA